MLPSRPDRVQCNFPVGTYPRVTYTEIDGKELARGIWPPDSFHSHDTYYFQIVPLVLERGQGSLVVRSSRLLRLGRARSRQAQFREPIRQCLRAGGGLLLCRLVALRAVCCVAGIDFLNQG